jgi:hypothetical protein
VRTLLVLLAACGAGARDTRPRPTLGSIAGLARNSATGEGLAETEIRVDGKKTVADQNGIYDLDVPPGRHSLVAEYGGQTVTVRNIDVVVGQGTFVDVPFTLGQMEPVDIDFTKVTGTEIQYFKTLVPRIEGTVSDVATRSRVAGAVVTAASATDLSNTLQTITDDAGRYRFDNVTAGTYAISAYYSIGGRGQIEVRRSDIAVGAGQGVLVPLFIELKR